MWELAASHWPVTPPSSKADGSKFNHISLLSNTRILSNHTELPFPHQNTHNIAHYAPLPLRRPRALAPDCVPRARGAAEAADETGRHVCRPRPAATASGGAAGTDPGLRPLWPDG